MRRLGQGVHTRIGAPGPLDDDLSIQKLFRRLSQRALNAFCVDLRLPAAVISAVVFEGKFKFMQGARRSVPLFEKLLLQRMFLFSDLQFFEMIFFYIWVSGVTSSAG